MKTRFLDDSDQNILSALSVIFDPASYSENQEDLGDHGTAATDLLENSFAMILPKDAQCSTEFDHFKRVVHRNVQYVAKNLPDLCKLLLQKHKDTYPGISALVCIALTTLVSSVDCESGFSRQNLIKNRTRNCLKDISLHKLMTCSIEALQSRDPSWCVHHTDGQWA